MDVKTAKRTQLLMQTVCLFVYGFVFKYISCSARKMTNAIC